MMVNKVTSPITPLELIAKTNEIIDNLVSGGGVVDQAYNASSSNAQSGTAVAEALLTKTLVTFRDWSVA